MPADMELMRRLAEGDSTAFDALFARYADRIRQRLARVVRDAAAVDDLLQDVFLRLWTRSGQWEGRGDPGAWLGRIAANLALNHLRSRRRERPLQQASGGNARDEEDAGANPLALIADATEAQPSEVLAAAERDAALAGLLAGLPPDKREVLRLVYEEDLNLREAAEELGIPVGTAKSRLHYARNRLVREWKAIAEELGDI